MTDTYQIYSEWFAHHYGRPFTVTREQWNEWCRRPAKALERADARMVDVLAGEGEEGWARGETR